MVSCEDGIDAVLDFLKAMGIPASREPHEPGEFNRIIEFKVYGIEYNIEWFTNCSHLRIGRHPRAARIPFRYIYVDRTYPLVDKNLSLGFSYHHTPAVNVFDREFPYEVFRIPLEI